MTNFDFLKLDKGFDGFSNVAITAEKLLHIDLDSSIISCRRAMEFAVKWMYSVDSDLVMPYDNSLYSIMSTEEFRDIVGIDILRRMEFIRSAGNNAVHSSKKVDLEQATLCLETRLLRAKFDVSYCM